MRTALLAFALCTLVACSADATRTSPRTSMPGEDPRTADLPVITTLVLADGRVTIHASPDGALYTVEDASGAVVVEAATQDELASEHPALHGDIEALLTKEGLRDVWAGAEIEREAIDAAPLETPGRTPR